MSRIYCLISPATSILECWDIFHSKGDIHSFVSSTSSFLYDIGEPRYEQNKMAYQISRIRNSVLLQCWQKKRPAQKGYFWSNKNVFYVIFFFSCLKMVFCELILLELGDLLRLSLLRNFLMRQGQFFSCNISARFLNISNSSNFIPHFVLLISRLPDIAQKSTYTQNVPMNVTFHLRYVPAS